jgi:hypothetical protein
MEKLERNEQQHQHLHLYGDCINLLGVQNAGKKAYDTVVPVENILFSLILFCSTLLCAIHVCC